MYIPKKAWPGLNKLHQYKSSMCQPAQARLITDAGGASPDWERRRNYKRGRNTNSHTKAKNADVVTYRAGFEAVMGYLSWPKMWSA